MLVKLIISIIILFISDCFAQRVTQAASATVNLIVPLSITATQGSLDFGEIILTGRSFRKRIQPNKGQKFIINGHPGRKISIIFNSITLTNSGSPQLIDRLGTLRFNPLLQSNSGVFISSGDTFILEENGKVGEFEIWAGGTIQIAADQPHGDYEGTFTLTVTY